MLLKLDAVTLSVSKNYNESISKYKEAIKRLPNDLLEELCFLDDKIYMDNLLKLKKECMIAITSLLMRIEDYDEAIKVAADVHSYNNIKIIDQLDDKCAEVYYYKGLAEEKLKNFEDSLNDLRIVTQLQHIG